MDKQLFLDDLRGLNGDLLQDLAFQELEELFDLDYGSEDIRELEMELDEAHRYVKGLQRENEQLEREPWEV